MTSEFFGGSLPENSGVSYFSALLCSLCLCVSVVDFGCGSAALRLKTRQPHRLSKGLSLES
jgi:hypothetical protein